MHRVHQNMHKSWLIANTKSGSYNAALCKTLQGALEQAGMPCAHLVSFPDEELPEASTLDEHGIDTVAIYTGDGTINSMVEKLSGWSGRVLILPGGTLNLLSKQLHGDRPPAEIIADAGLVDVRLIRPPMIVGGGLTALVGLIAGPTTAWNDVRESMRARDLGGLVNAVPNAISETFEGDGVWLEGDAGDFPALYLWPTEEGVYARGVLADTAARMIGHGIAWLGGDFRDGPHEDLGVRDEARIKGKGTVGVLYDGEKGEVPSGTTFNTRAAHVDFIATIHPDDETSPLDAAPT